MKKINKNIVLLCLGILLTYSCSEDFVDNPPHNTTDLATALSIENLEAAVVGMYPPLQEVGWYGADMLIVPEICGDNSRKSDVKNSGRYLEYYSFTVTENSTNFELWENAYYIIREANSIIDFASEYEDVEYLLAEAYAIRAIAHFDLCRFFAHRYNYSTGAAHMGVPVITENLEDPEAQKPARNTVAEVITQVIADLQQAQTLFTADDEDAGTIYRFNLTSVNALLARVYLYIGDWANAAQSATNVINAVGTDQLYTTDNYISVWASDETSESIFEINMQLTDDYFPGRGHTPGNLYSYYFYGDIVIDDDFVGTFGDADIRKKLIYLDPNSEYRHVKFPGKGNAFDMDDFDIADYEMTIPEVNNTRVIRLCEMLLTRAEANIEAGTSTGATPAEDINNIRTKRGLSGLSTVTINDVLNERRKELAFEGDRFFTLKRRGLDVVRTTCVLEENCTVPADDDLFQFPIPVEEMTSNPNMVQND